MITPKEVKDRLKRRTRTISIQCHSDNPSYLTGTWDFCATGKGGVFKFRLDELFLCEQPWGYGFPRCKLEREILLTTIASEISRQLA